MPERVAQGWDEPVKSAGSSDWERRSNNFDFLRLALAVVVLYSHSYPLATGTEAAEPIRRWTHGQLTGGGVAVDLFFVMSGFLITASAERSRSVWSFLRKRVARIYPGFVVAALAGLILFMPWSGAHLAERGAWWKDAVLPTLRLREFIYSGAFQSNPYPGVINGSTWSVSCEFWCYIGVALLTVAGALRRRWALLGLFAVSVMVSFLFAQHGWVLGGKLLGRVVGPPQIWARLLPVYLAGVVFYLFRAEIPRRRWLAVVSAELLAGAALLPFGLTVMFPLAGTYLVLYAAYSPRLRLQHFGRFGDFSYGTYLYAFPIEQLLMRGFGHAMAPALLFVCALPLTLLAAAASWYGVERRFLSAVRQKETPLHAHADGHGVKVHSTG